MEINLTNNAAWKKKEPPTLSHNHDKKGNKGFGVFSVKKAFRNQWKDCSCIERFQVLSQSIQAKEESIKFMPAIPANPHKKLIQEIINRTMRCKCELQLEYIFLEVEQTILQVLQVLFNQKVRYKSFCNKLIVRMGSFQIVFCPLKTINSHFYDSGKNYFLRLKLVPKIILYQRSKLRM